MPSITGLLSRATDDSDLVADRGDRVGAGLTGAATRASRALNGASHRVHRVGEHTAERARDRYTTGTDPFDDRVVEGLLDWCEPTPADERPEDPLLRALHCVEDGLAGYDPEDRDLIDALLEAAREEYGATVDRSDRSKRSDRPDRPIGRPRESRSIATGWTPIASVAGSARRSGRAALPTGAHTGSNPESTPLDARSTRDHS